MRVSYRVEETETGSIISVFDDIDLANANMLADALFNLVDAHRDIVVDLRALRYIDSVGLHILLRAAQRAQRLGAAMTVVAVGPTRQLVEQVGLDRLMPILEDVPAARPAPTTEAPPIAARGVTPPPAAKPSVKPDRTKPTEPSRSDR
ncbi:MAG TPA: STAS domain-containing protein [bacterium]|nr:STAS domain-containing protein [bacterium]